MKLRRLTDAAGGVIDEDSGITIRPNIPDGNQLLFIFADKRSAAASSLGVGRFRFNAIVKHGSRTFEKDGRTWTRGYVSGYELGRAELERTFENYTGGDPAAFDLLCDLISTGLRCYAHECGDPSIHVVFR